MTEPTNTADGTLIPLTDGWQAKLTQDVLIIENAANKEIYEIPRLEANAKIERINLEKRTPTFFAHIPKPRRFSLKPEGARELLEWLGPETPSEALHQLRRKVGQNIPIGILYLLTAFSNLWWWVIGGVLITTGLLFKYRPRVWLFLLDGLFWLLVMLFQAYSFANAPGWWSGTFFVLNAYWLYQSFQLFKRFQTHNLAPA